MIRKHLDALLLLGFFLGVLLGIVITLALAPSTPIAPTPHNIPTQPTVVGVDR